MLIEFSVSNFRSFRERQTFQMTAAPRLGKKENTFPAGAVGEKLPNLLKVAAIYGGNASGKTSLISALEIFYKLANWKPLSEPRPLPVSPFRFDPELLDKPSTFEVHFVANNTRYQFRVAATAERIFEEVLYVYPRGKEALLYSRHYNGESDEYEFGSLFEGDQIVRGAWRKLTGPQSLFISQAVLNSSEELNQLRPPFGWLNSGLFVGDGLEKWKDVGRRLPSDEDFGTALSGFLEQVDIPVTDIRFEPIDSLGESGEPLKVSKDGEKNLRLIRAKGKTTLTHSTRLGNAKFDFSEESKGTQNLIGIFLPWLMLKVNARAEASGGDRKYRMLVIDEFDSSLHPEIVEHLVKQHIESGAESQLIFTTHDTHLMSAKLLRRDQFWLVDRNSNGASRLRSIHSVEGREGEDVERRYFEGRYRGLPIRRSK